MTEMFFMQLIVVAIAIVIGAKLGGAGLGMAGGAGLFVLTFVFGLKPAGAANRCHADHHCGGNRSRNFAIRRRP